MLISTVQPPGDKPGLSEFQSLDWVDVDFDTPLPSHIPLLILLFQSLDWVDVDFDSATRPPTGYSLPFQSLDWVDVDFDNANSSTRPLAKPVSIPRLG